MIRRRTAAAALAVAVAFAAAAVVSATLVSRERLILRCQNDVCVARRRRTGKKKKNFPSFYRFLEALYTLPSSPFMLYWASSAR